MQVSPNSFLNVGNFNLLLFLLDVLPRPCVLGLPRPLKPGFGLQLFNKLL